MRGSVLILSLAFLSFAACAEPAALRVEIEVREPGLQALRVAVVSDPDKGRVSELSCTFTAGERADKDCELSDGTGVWGGGLETLSFWLYGAPKTELSVSAAGLRDAGSPVVSTSTETRAALPDEPGDEAVLNLSLVARTRIHDECGGEIPTMGGGNLDRSTLAIADLVDDAGGQPEILVTSGNSLAFFQFHRLNGKCVPLPPPNYPERFQSCVYLENSMVAGRRDDSGKKMFGGACLNGNVLISAGSISASGSPNLETYSSTTARPVLSRPVLADLDGDHVKELYFLTVTRRVLELIRWSPEQRSLARLELSGLAPFTPNNPALHGGPLVVHDPRNQRDVLIIAGYPGGIGIVTGGMNWRYQWVQDEPNAPSMGASAVVVSDAQELVVKVAVLYGGRELRVTVLEGLAPEWNVRDNFSLLGNNDFDTRVERDTRLALGDIDGSGTLVAITVQEGEAIIYPLEEGAKVRTLPVWSGSAISGVQSVLLANVDGMPGAEIIAFDSTNNLIHAVNFSGAPLDGWPLEAPAGGQLRVALADLDPPDAPERDLEVIALSQQSLQIFSLGPGSYDPKDSDWPMIFADSAARGSIKP
jgi:hypothetical protein